MKHLVKSVILLICASFPASALSQISYSTDFNKLKEEHQKALQAVTGPVNRRYGTDLDNLLRKATQSSDLDTALKIKEEMKALGIVANEPTSGTTPEANACAAFAGKWDHTETGWHDVWDLMADGNAKSAMTDGTPREKGKWSIQGNRLVVRWPRNTYTFQLPATGENVTGTTDHFISDPKKGGQVNLKRLLP